MKGLIDMKKSMLYRMAQISVIRDNVTPDVTKLEVLKMLFDREDFEKLVEKEKEQNDENRK